LFRGWILDVKAGTTSGGGATLILSDGTRRVTAALPQARFHLYFKPKWAGLVGQLLDHPDADGQPVGDALESTWTDGSGQFYEEWFAPPWYTSTIRVANLAFRSLGSLTQIERRMIDEGAAQVYNRYPDRFTQLFWQLGLPPTTLVAVDCDGASRVEPLEKPLREDYVQPGFSWAELRVYDWYGEAFYPLLGRRPTHFSLRLQRAGRVVHVDREDIGRLEAYAKEASQVDVLCYPRAYYRLLREAGVWLEAAPIRLDRRGPSAEHVGDALIRLIEWSRVSSTPLRLLAESSIGKPLTANEARVAFSRRWLVPDTPPPEWAERWRTMSELLDHDRGGLIFRPKPGLYFNVAQLDFTSMYPTIIAKWNVSPETVDNPTCTRAVKVPCTTHSVELDRRGVVPEALEWLIRRRERLRALAAERGDATLGARQAAVKWLLVASFGYLGFRNARFGKIGAYECVTALSRWAMRGALDAVIRRGYRVLHVMVDSLFVQRWDAAPFTPGEVERLINAVEDASGLGVKLEASYRWVVFSRDRESTLAAPQRYYGLLSGGELKVKGLECVKPSAPLIVRLAQLEALSCLKQAVNQKEFYVKLGEAEKQFRKYWSRVLDQPRLGDTVDAGRHQSLYAMCIRNGKRVTRGGIPGYLWVIKGVEGYYPAEEGYRDVDQAHYLRLLGGAWEQIDPRPSDPRATLKDPGGRAHTKKS
jgi:DNA polymerase I